MNDKISNTAEAAGNLAGIRWARQNCPSWELDNVRAFANSPDCDDILFEQDQPDTWLYAIMSQSNPHDALVQAAASEFWSSLIRESGELAPVATNDPRFFYGFAKGAASVDS